MDATERERMEEVLVGPADAEIVALEARIRAAHRAADVPALDALVSADLLFTGPDERLVTKAEDLAAHRAGFVCFRVHEPEELRVRRVGDGMAVSALLARLVIDVGATRVEGVFRYTRVWAREADGDWRVVGGHVSAVPSVVTASSESSAP